VLIFDLSKKESFEQIERWFVELKNYAGDIKIILIGNKCDLPPNKIEISEEEAKHVAYMNDAKYLSCSAIDDKNITEIFSTLAVEIYHHKKKKNQVTNRRKSLKLKNNDGSGKNGCCG